MRVLASVTLLVCGEQAWVARRSAHGTMPGLLECAGGAVEDGEDIDAAAVREVREETGLVLDQSRFKASGLLMLPDMDITLHLVTVGLTERPRDTEPHKRNAWMLTPVARLRFEACTPGLGALAAVFCHALRAKGVGL
mgnify:CR=1 FL=1